MLTTFVLTILLQTTTFDLSQLHGEDLLRVDAQEYMQKCTYKGTKSLNYSTVTVEMRSKNLEKTDQKTATCYFINSRYTELP